jgi:nucleoid-associated protein YejK
MTKEIKKIGSNIEIKGLIIHQVVKDSGTRHTVLKQADDVLTIQEKEKLFIGRINKAYFQKSGPIYGIFGDEDPKFKNLLNTYLLNKDFYSFSTEALSHYKTVLETSAPATGGFLIFAHFLNTDNHNEYMLVLTINNKDGYVVSETDLSIKDIKNLDLNKVDVASMINLTKWKNIEVGIDVESKTYLSFVKGNKNVSYYFMSFIDCDNKTTNSESTQLLTNAIDEYCDLMNYDREMKIRKRNEIFIYCEGCIKEKKEIQLSTISAMFDAENPTAFEEFAADENYGVSSIISGDITKLKRMKFVHYKNKELTVEFDLKLLGKEVVYNSQKRELTIKKLPQELIDQIPQN